MSHHKQILGAWALAVLLSAMRASADGTPNEGSMTATNKSAFKVSMRSGETVGIQQIQRAFLDIGTNQIAFMIPGGFQMNAARADKIVLTEPERGYFMTVRVITLAEAGSEASFFKTEALNHYPGARITQESTTLVANHSGPAFTLEWSSSTGTVQSARVVFIPSAAGILEFTLTARSATFKDAQIYFDCLLSSVQNNESGKLVIIPLPDFS